MAFTWSVSSVASMLSSARARPSSKLKKSLTLEPHKVAGLDLEPPKNNLACSELKIKLLKPNERIQLKQLKCVCYDYQIQKDGRPKLIKFEVVDSEADRIIAKEIVKLARRITDE